MLREIRSVARHLSFDAVSVGLIVVVSLLGAMIFALLASSGNRSVASEVEATAQLSTGLVQGSTLTLASYEYEGSEKYVMATGGPYFADDTFTLLVDDRGEVVSLSSGPEVALPYVVIVCVLLVYFVVVVVVDP